MRNDYKVFITLKTCNLKLCADLVSFIKTSLMMLFSRKTTTKWSLSVTSIFSPSVNITSCLSPARLVYPFPDISFNKHPSFFAHTTSALCPPLSHFLLRPGFASCNCRPTDSKSPCQFVVLSIICHVFQLSYSVILLLSPSSIRQPDFLMSY